MSTLKGSYIGFSYGTEGNLIHSSSLGLVRVSNGSRFEDTLLPSIKNTSTDIPGSDGEFYFGTKFNSRDITLSVAFDNVNETQLRDIQRLFGEKGIHYLILDETPYKIYKVVLSKQPSFKYVAFDQPDMSASLSNQDELYGHRVWTQSSRIYKGEATFNFTAYDPFAFSRYKYTEFYTNEYIPEWQPITTGGYNYNNYNEWASRLSLKSKDYTQTIGGTTYKIDTPNNTATGGVLIYNPGDLSTPFNYQFVPINRANAIPGITFTGAINNETYGMLSIASFNLYSTDYAIRINTKLHLIEGLKSDGNNNWVPSGTVYNEYITGGDFFKLPVSPVGIQELESYFLSITLTDTTNISSVNFDYKYLFY